MPRPTRTYVPTPEWLTLDWHHACIAAGWLCIQQCARCGRWRHPPRRCCPDCFSDASEFRPVVGTGSIRSLAVSHRSLDPGWHERAPYAVLLVELTEGGVRLRPWLVRPLPPGELDELAAAAGLRLEARWADWHRRPWTPDDPVHVSVYGPR